MGTRILILCTGNSCRSQMAEGILRALDPTIEVFSAGTVPAAAVHPKAITVMKEIGIDLSTHVPKSVNLFLMKSFDYVITVCDHAKETCPVFLGKVTHRLHIGFRDPAEATGTEENQMAMFRSVRDEIRTAMKDLYKRINERGEKGVVE
jgi:arsenate reductase (thioredoxin)